MSCDKLFLSAPEILENELHISAYLLEKIYNFGFPYANTIIDEVFKALD